jgi:histidinol-phosphate/aromatic aminotransferase/cobyric acid decarboxylase-like protein
VAGPHGGDAEAVARWLGVPVDDVVDLSASLNPFAPDVATVITDIAGSVRRYPDPTRATELLADAIGVASERLVLTNGGAEAIALVAALEPIGRVDAPEFSLYERHLTEVVDVGPQWRSNPSNPLGRLADPGETARVWDEAFWQIATGTWTRGDEDSWRLGSMTKLWACPGLRLGYAIAPSDADAGALRRRQPQWSVNGPALAVVERLLPLTDLAGWSRSIGQRRAALVGELRTLGVPVTDTDACWVLVDRPGLRDELLPYGVVVRDCASFGLPGIHRIAVPTDAQAERLGVALRAVVADGTGAPSQ